MMDVRNFGAVGNGVANDTQSIQAAIDFAELFGGHVYIPKAVYRADGLLLKTGVKVVGDGREQSVIKARDGSLNEAVFGIPSGVVQDVLLKDLGITAAGNPNQSGIHIAARRSATDTASGLWHSDFIGIRVFGFARAQVWLQGGGADSLDPIQFLRFDGAVLERDRTTGRSVGVLMSGQVNQTTWINGRSDSFGAGSAGNPGVNVKICRQLNYFSADVSGTDPYVSQKSGHTHSFLGFSVQQSELGVYLDRAESVSFDTCHFEGLGSGIKVAGASMGIRVDRSHFANSALGGEQAFSIQALGASTVCGRANFFGGQYGRMSDADGGSSCVWLEDSASASVIRTNNATRQIAASESVDLGRFRTALINSTGVGIKFLNSLLLPGESIVVKALSGPIQFLAGGNIDLGNDQSYIVPSGRSIQITRFDKGLPWSVLQNESVGGSTPASSVITSANRWYACHGASVSSASFGAGVLRGSRLSISNDCVLAEIGCEVTDAGSAGSVVRMGVYAVDLRTLNTTLLVDAGTVDASTLGVKTAMLSYPILAGQTILGVAVPQVNGTGKLPSLRTVVGHDPQLSAASISSIASVGAVGLQAAGVLGSLPIAPAMGLASAVYRTLLRCS